MKKQFFVFLLLLLFFSSVSAQEKEAVKIDEFGRIPCGDFMARMDNLLVTFQNSPDSEIYVVYYGGRFRKENLKWNPEKRRYDLIKLHFPHRDDGLNWAKSIPLFLTTYNSYRIEIRNLVKEKIILLDGGFREDVNVEIWIVPKRAKPPESTPTIDEKYIKFRNDKPFGIPNCTTAYGMYK